MSGIKSNTHKGQGYNEISMDDTAKKEKITIHAQYDMNTTVENNDTHYPDDHYPNVHLPASNTPLHGKKGDVYEGGIRTPGIAYWPGRLSAGTVNAPLHVVDWMPTLCGLAGYVAKDDLKWDGMNVWPVVSGEVKSPGVVFALQISTRRRAPSAGSASGRCCFIRQDNPAWPQGAIVHDNTLDAYVARIRRKLRDIDAPEGVETLRGVGYVLR